MKNKAGIITFLAAVLVAWGRSARGADAAATARQQQEVHGLPQQAVEIARPFGLPITNSLVVTWIVAVGLIVFAQPATRRMKRIPEGAQSFWELLIEDLSRFLEGVISPHLEVCFLVTAPAQLHRHQRQVRMFIDPIHGKPSKVCH